MVKFSLYLNRRVFVMSNSSRADVKNRFSKLSWWPFWISNLYDFSRLLLYLLVRIAFDLIYRVVCEEMSKIDFQDGRCGGHLGFPIGTILVIFDQEVILLLQCKFQLKSPKGLGGEVKKGSYCGHFGFPISIILANFYLYVSLLLYRKFQLNLLKMSKTDFHDGGRDGYLRFPIYRARFGSNRPKI